MKTTKRIKSIIAVLLATAIVAGMFNMSASAADTSQTYSHKVEFTDVTPDKWYYEAVMAMADAGAINGYGNGKFGPNDPITNGQFFLIVMRLCWPEAYVDQKRTLDGIDNQYACAMLDASIYLQSGPFATTGGVCAVKDGKFVPAGEWWAGSRYEAERGKLPDQWKDVTPMTYINTPVQRGQAMTYMAKLANKLHLLKAQDNIKETDIPDWDAVAANDVFTIFGSTTNGSISIRIGVPTLWKDWVLKAYQMGIVQGTDGNKCDPTGTVTRAQFCQMLYNMGVTGSLADKTPFLN